MKKQIYKSEKERPDMLIGLVLVIWCVTGFLSNLNAQVSTYTYSSSLSSYSAITGGTLLGVSTIDDNSYTAQPIGFTFTYNSINYTTFGINANGWISMGSAAPSNSYTPLSSGATNNVIAALGRDLQGGSLFSSPFTPGELRYQTIGSIPNRTLVIQWKAFRKYSASSTGLGDNYNFQIRLNETTNVIDIVYGSFANNGNSTTVQVGLRGSSNADFNNRTANLSGWATTNPGLSNSASMNLSNSNLPTNGRKFTWSPAVVTLPPSCASGMLPANGAVAPASTSQLAWAATPTATGYDIYFGTSPSPGLVSSNQVGTNYSVTLAGSSTYYYKIVPRNANGPATGCSVASFSTNNDYYFPVGTTTVTSCNANFFDIGGPGGAYQVNADQTITFQPAIPGNSIAITFLSFQTETNYDPLYIYNGPNTTYPLFSSGNGPSNTGFPAGGYWGSALPGPFVSGDVSGALTIRFRSDGSVQQAGWTAVISCVAPTPPLCSNSNVPANGSTNVYKNQVLSWTSGSANTANYDVYFGTSATPPLVSSSQAGTSYNPGIMAGNTTYYYQIVPKNNYGPATGCPINSFTTGNDLLYCIPTYSSNCTSNDFINNFTFNTLSHLGTGCNGSYTHFPASGNTTTTVNLTLPYNISMSSGTQWAQGFRVWIDYNQNGSFNDAGESVYNTTTIPTAGSTVSGTVTIPATALTGQTRMRVRCAWNTTPTAAQSCSNLSFGESHDYTITILPAPPPLAVTASSATICDGSVAGSTLSVTTGLALYQDFSWAPAAGLSATTGSVVVANPSVTTTYTLTAATIADNLTNSATVTITVLPKPVVTITEPNYPGNPAYLCGGGSISPTANATLNLCGGGTFTINVNSGGWLDETTWNLKNASNIIIAQGGPYGFGGSYTVNVTTSAVPLSFFIETQGTFNDNVANYSIICSGTTVASGTANGGSNQTVNNICCSGGGNNIASYSWTSNPPGFTSGLANPTITPPTGSTTYMVEVAGTNGCTTTANLDVISNPNPSPKLLPNDTILCAGATIQVFFTDTGAYAGGYPSGTTFDYGFGPSTIDNMIVNGPGLYNVIVQLPAGYGYCLATSPYANLQYNDAPVVIPSAVNVQCFGENNGSATAEVFLGSAPFRFKWYDKNGLLVRDTITSNTTDALGGLVAGDYSLVVSDNAFTLAYPPPSCQSDSIVITITQPAELILSSTKTDELCFGQSIGSVDLTLSGGVSPFAFLWSNNEITEDISGLAAGTYTVIVTQGNNCTNQLTASITEPALLTSSITKSNYNGSDISCYGLADGSADLLVNGGTTPYSYNWSNGSILEDIAGLLAGVYDVTVTDDHGCITNSSATLVNPPALDISSAAVTSNYNGSQVSCFGEKDGIITVLAGGGTGALSYQINAGIAQASGLFSGLGSGSYTALVSDVNNCSLASSSIVITDPPQVAGSSSVTSDYNGSQVSCFGFTDGIITVTSTGGTGILEYSLNGSPFQVSNVFNNLGASNYSCIVKDVNGCSITTVSVSVSNPPQVVGSAAVTSNYNGRDVSCFGSTDGVITILANGGTGVLSYRKNAGIAQASNIFEGLGAGDYDFIIADLNNCNITTPKIAVTNPPLLTSTLTSTAATYWHAANGSATVNANGGTLPYSYIWNDPAFQTTATATGLMARMTPIEGYTATVTDINGCTVTGNVIITEPIYNCGNPKEFTDAQIGQWGGNPSGTNYTYPLNGGQIPNYLAANFAAAFPGPNFLRIGCGSRWLVFTYSGAIAASLPSGGTARQLNAGTMVNPTSAQYSNQFASRLVAAKLNVLFDAWDPLFSGGPTVTAGDMIYTGNVTEYYGKPLKWLVAHADSVIGCGSTDATKYSKLSTVMLHINNGQYSCPSNLPIKTEGENQVFGSLYFKVYPNPTSGQVAVDFFGGENQTYQVEIMDMLGKTFIKDERQTTTEGITQLYYNLEDKPKGIYLVRLTVKGRTEISKLILQ